MANGTKGYRVNVVRGSLSVNGRVVDRSLDVGAKVATVVERETVAETCAAAFGLGMLAGRVTPVEPGDAVTFSGADVVCSTARARAG